MYRSKEFKIFDAESPEYALVDSISSEMFSYGSPKILWWCYNAEDTEAASGDLEKLYGESYEPRKFNGPFDVNAYIEVNPILIELNKLGIQQKEEINISVNATYFKSVLNSDPKAGDVLSVDYMDGRRVLYAVSSVNPSDLFNFKYTNFLVNAEQTQMSDVDQSIRDYINQF